jgi:hypothetical protein
MVWINKRASSAAQARLRLDKPQGEALTQLVGGQKLAPCARGRW